MDERTGVKASTCPRCQYKMDAASCLEDETARPNEGDLTVCLNCGQVLVFDHEIEPTLPTPTDLAKLDRETKRQLFRTSMAVMAVRETRGGAHLNRKRPSS